MTDSSSAQQVQGDDPPQVTVDMRRLQAMLSAGIISAGDNVVFEIKSSRYCAVVALDGSLIHKLPATSPDLPQTEVYRSPSEWALEMAKRHNLKRNPRARIRGRITVNGWEECSIAGRSLQELRSAMMRDSRISSSLRDEAAFSSPLKPAISSPLLDDISVRSREDSPLHMRTSASEPDATDDAKSCTPHGPTYDELDNNINSASQTREDDDIEDEDDEMKDRDEIMEDVEEKELEKSDALDDEDIVESGSWSKDSGVPEETDHATVPPVKESASLGLIENGSRDDEQTLKLSQDSSKPSDLDVGESSAQVAEDSASRSQLQTKDDASEAAHAELKENLSLKSDFRDAPESHTSQVLHDAAKLSEANDETCAMPLDIKLSTVSPPAVDSAKLEGGISSDKANFNIDERQLVTTSPTDLTIDKGDRSVLDTDMNKFVQNIDTLQREQHKSDNVISATLPATKQVDEDSKMQADALCSQDMNVHMDTGEEVCSENNDENIAASGANLDVERSQETEGTSTVSEQAVHDLSTARKNNSAHTSEQKPCPREDASPEITDSADGKQVSTSAVQPVPDEPKTINMLSESDAKAEIPLQSGAQGQDSNETKSASTQQCEPAAQSDDELESNTQIDRTNSSNLEILPDPEEDENGKKACDSKSESDSDVNHIADSSIPRATNTKELKTVELEVGAKDEISLKSGARLPPTAHVYEEDGQDIDIEKRSVRAETIGEVRKDDVACSEAMKSRSSIVGNANVPGSNISCPNRTAQPDNQENCKGDEFIGIENVTSTIVQGPMKYVVESTETNLKLAKKEVVENETAWTTDVTNPVLAEADDTNHEAVLPASSSPRSREPETLTFQMNDEVEDRSPSKDEVGESYRLTENTTTPADADSGNINSAAKDGSENIDDAKLRVETDTIVEKPQSSTSQPVHEDGDDNEMKDSEMNSREISDIGDDVPADPLQSQPTSRSESDSESGVSSQSISDEKHSIAAHESHKSSGNDVDSSAAQGKADHQGDNTSKRMGTEASIGRKRGRDSSSDGTEERQDSSKRQRTCSDEHSVSSAAHQQEVSDSNIHSTKVISRAADDDVEGDDEMDDRPRSSRRARVSHVSRSFNSDLLTKAGYFEGITDDPAAAEAAAVAAAAEKEEAVNRARRTTRLAAGKIKQVDYKVSAALSTSRPASLSGNEVENSEDDGGNGISELKRHTKRQRTAHKSSRTPTRDRHYRMRSVYDEKEDDSVSDGTTTHSRYKSKAARSSALVLRGNRDNAGSSNGSQRVDIDDNRDGDGASRSENISDDDAPVGRFARDTGSRSPVDMDENNAANSSGSIGHDSFDAGSSGSPDDPVSTSNGATGAAHDEDLNGVDLQENLFHSSRQRPGSKVAAGSVEDDLDGDDDDVFASESNELNIAQDDSAVRDEDGWGIPELSAIANAVKSTASCDPLTVFNGIPKVDSNWSSYGRTQEDVSRYLKNVSGYLRDFCPRSATSTSGDCSIRLNDVLSFIAAEVWRLCSGVHRPAGAISKQIRKEAIRRSSREKSRRKLKRDLEETRAKLEGEMDIRRKLSLESAYHQIRIGDCKRAYEREKAKRMKTEHDIGTFQEREKDARDRTEKIKFLALQLRNDGIVENEVSDGMQVGTTATAKAMEVDYKANERLESNVAKRIVGKTFGDGKGSHSGSDGESITSGELGRVAENKHGDTSRAIDPPEHSSKKLLSVRRLRAMIATYQAEAERGQRENEMERVRVNSLLEIKNKLEQDIYIQRTSWSPNTIGHGLPPSAGPGRISKDHRGRRLESAGRSAVRNMPGPGRVKGTRTATTTFGAAGEFTNAGLNGADVGADTATTIATEESGQNPLDASKSFSRRKGLPVRSPHS